MKAHHVNSEDGEVDAEHATTMHSLEEHYARATPLTLGKLRGSLETISALCASRPPNILELARVIRHLGLEQLPLSSVEALVEACSDAQSRDIAGHFTLKQLEELLGRIERV